MIRAATLAALALLLTGCIALPAGLQVYVSENGCTPEGVCPYGGQSQANYYYSPTRTIVLAPQQGTFILIHEACHAHQHQVVLDAKMPSTVDLNKWYLTSEGQAFMAATDWSRDACGAFYNPAPSPWGYVSDWTPIEDAANTCAVWLLGMALDGPREEWAERWLR